MLRLTFYPKLAQRPLISLRIALRCTLCKLLTTPALEASDYTVRDMPMIVEMGYCPFCFTYLTGSKTERARIMRVAVARRLKYDQQESGDVSLPLYRQGMLGISAQSPPSLWRPAGPMEWR